MNKFVRSHFPSSKERFYEFFKLFYPMIIGSTLYALNGFVDNFMVGHIQQGGTALSTVNSWTNIMMGIFVGISAAGSVINARYYFAGQYEKAQQLFKFRLLLGLFISSAFALIAWVQPDSLIKVFLKSKNGLNDPSYMEALDRSREYMKIIAISWILISITASLANSLREVGFSKASMFWGIGTIITNVTLNSILMYGFSFGVDGAAYASVASRLVALTWGVVYLTKVKTNISFNIFKIFFFKKEVIKDFLSKWYLFLSFSIVTLFITFRNYFYDAGYPTSIDSSLGNGVGAMSILSLTGAIMNIFTTSFSAAGSMSSNIVGKQLAQGKTQEAFNAAKELKGFITLVSMILSLLLAIFASAVPYMEFLSSKKVDVHGSVTFDNISNLTNVRNSLWVIALFYPMWIWFTVSYRAGSTGKKGFWFSFVDMVISGPIQLGWLAILAYIIIPNSTFMQHNFWLTYSLFFFTDFFKLIVQEILFYKYKWNTKITEEENKEIQAEMDDEITASQLDML